MRVSLRIRRNVVQTMVVLTALMALLFGVERYASTAASQTPGGTYESNVLVNQLVPAGPVEAITGLPNFTG